MCGLPFGGSVCVAMTGRAPDRARIAAVQEALQRGNFAAAEQQASALLREHHDLPDALHLRAMALREQGRPGAARADLEACLAHDPTRAMAWLHLGLIAAAQADTATACDAFEQAVQNGPRVAEAWYRRAVCRYDRQWLDGALDDLRRARDLAPGEAVLRAWEALVRAARGEWDQALRLVGDPDGPGDGETWLYLARARATLGQVGPALAAWEHALSYPEVAVTALNDRGVFALERKRWRDALSDFRAALAREPGRWESLAHLAFALAEGTRYGGLAEAPAELDETLEQLAREHGEKARIWTHTALIHELQGDAEAALAAFERALALGDRGSDTRRGRLRNARALCVWDHVESDVAWLREDIARRAADRFDIQAFLSLPGLDATDHYACARQIAVREQALAAPYRLDAGACAEHGRPLRIGYLSADFRRHPTAWLIAGVFEAHARERVEAYGYSLAPDDGSAIRRRLASGLDRLRDMNGQPDEAIAASIAADGVDILVDLMGYTTGCRPGVLARRPAPLQVAYLGYPGTTGADYIDYILADAFVLPCDQFAHYTESVAWLPGTYQCNDSRPAAGPATSRAAEGLPADAPVLACFNGPQKLTPELFALWCRILREAPAAVLWLYAPNQALRDNLRSRAQELGVEPDRLYFAQPRPHAEHLARVALADVFVDTLPYNAHTTASDALRMGVPVVTCPGDTFAARVAGSLLHAAGLPELVQPTLEAYADLATALLRDPVRLDALKQRVCEARDTSRLFDTRGFTRDLEALYAAMWARCSAGKPPAHLALDEHGCPVWSE